MRRQSQTQLTAAVAMTLAVSISASVGCVSVHHDWAQHCGFDKLRESKKSYYHCAHCGQIVANPHAKCCPHCAYVKPYYGYEPTCWNKFPEGWGCPNGAQACHPEMLEMVPPVEYIDGIPVESDSVHIQHDAHQVPLADESVSGSQVADEDEHAIPSASDRVAPPTRPAASNLIDSHVPAAKNTAKPRVRPTDQTQAAPVSQKRSEAVLPPMESALVDGMIEAPVPRVASSQSVTKDVPVVDKQAAASEPKPMVLNFPVPSPERAVTVDKVPTVTRVPVPQVDKVPVTKTPEVKTPVAKISETKTATSVSVKTSAAAAATPAAPQAKPARVAEPEFKPSAAPQDDQPKVQRIAVPQPKTKKLETVASVAKDASAAPSKPQSVTSPETLDISAEQWNRIVTMPVAAAAGMPTPEASTPESYEMKSSFEPVSIEAQSPRMVPTMTHLPKRVPTIPVEKPASTREFSEANAAVEMPAPVRRIPASVQQLMGKNTSPVTTTQNVTPTQNVLPSDTVAPVVNRIPLGQVTPASVTAKEVAPKYTAPNPTRANLYPAPANRIQIR
ncbi:hypothetical protein [Novipirellula maiorica]|nr:hypothetical protein [Rhodopirellula maiorica]